MANNNGNDDTVDPAEAIETRFKAIEDDNEQLTARVKELEAIKEEKSIKGLKDFTVKGLATLASSYHMLCEKVDEYRNRNNLNGQDRIPVMLTVELKTSPMSGEANKFQKMLSKRGCEFRNYTYVVK